MFINPSRITRTPCCLITTAVNSVCHDIKRLSSALIAAPRTHAALSRERRPSRLVRPAPRARRRLCWRQHLRGRRCSPLEGACRHAPGSLQKQQIHVGRRKHVCLATLALRSGAQKGTPDSRELIGNTVRCKLIGYGTIALPEALQAGAECLQDAPDLATRRRDQAPDPDDP